MSAKVLPMMLVLLWTIACSPAPSGPPRGYISSAELGDKWPLTVEEGVLACDRSAVTFRTNEGQVYALNGLAMSRGFLEITPIQRVAPPPNFIPLERLPESDRRAIFAEIVRCEREGERQATAKYPDPNDFMQQMDLEEKLTAQCKAALTKRHKLTTVNTTRFRRKACPSDGLRCRQCG